MRQTFAYTVAIGAMASIAYGCWLWNEGLGLVIGGAMALITAVDIKEKGPR